MKEIKIFAPATIANISCGFDVLGCCLDAIGDEMIVRKSQQKGIKITKIVGDDLPLETEKNVAGVAALALLDALNFEIDYGFEIEIYKNIKPGSGVGSSAASAAGSVFAINQLLGKPFSKIELVVFASEGERLACGSPIADNVAPAIFGGFTLVKSTNPLKIIELPTIDELYTTIIHPQIEIKTADSRAILPNNIPLKKAVKQWANVGALIHALHTNDYLLFSESLTDYIVEPYRSKLIPDFDLVKESALKAGALGCGISGSGPSIFTFSKSKPVAESVAIAINDAYSKNKIPFHIYVSKINLEGIKIINS
ncbi:MAG: homoserine kinase [Flavobacteriaceae bacterium]|nr:homoserine kinase [Flavobacteriaceae bacterium]